MDISIHAPRTGSDVALLAAPAHAGNFNPRSPHGERLGMAILPPKFTHFNPRSPHGERPSLSGKVVVHALFQSTLPARGATILPVVAKMDFLISIHAPRTGSDSSSATTLRATRRRFQSTLPARGAT